MNQNRKVGIILASVAAGMLGMAFAAVPLYRMFCQVTGFNGTTLRAAAPSQTKIDRTVTVRFNSNIAPGLDWEFAPVVNTMEVALGDNVLAFYKATNHSDRPIVGSATFNVTPEQAGGFFNKVECFCFTEQRLEPGEAVEMPVSFFIDPAIVNDPDASHARVITLSYTFYRVQNPKSGVAASAAPASKVTPQPTGTDPKG